MTIFWSDLVGCGRIIVESGRMWSDYRRIVFLSAEAFRELPLKSWASRFRGRRTIWWGCRVPLLAPRSGNEVAYVTQIIDDVHFAWQAQYLVMLEGDFTCSTHWKWRFICDADQWWHSFCVAGAVFGEVRVGLFVAGAALRDILGDSLDAKCCILQYKIVSKMTIFWSDLVGCGRNIVESGRMWSDYRRIVFLLAEAFRGCLCLLRAVEMRLHMWRRSLMTFILRGRRSIWWGWRVTLLAPRIGNDVSYVTQIIDDLHFAWQAQYLVRLEGDFTCSTHWKWCFICEADLWWLRYCVAGAVFGEVGGWLHFLRALEMKFHMSRRSLMTFILRGWHSICWCWRVTLLAPRIGNDVSYVTQIIDDIHCAWQAQYLVKLDGDSCCAAHCKWRFKVDRWG